jgi:hypothetical protein
MKRWKLALSLAVVAALAVPALAGTWRLAPGKWVDLTASEKQRIENDLKRIATNLSIAASAFALTFALVMLGPLLGRRYLAWLRR